MIYWRFKSYIKQCYCIVWCVERYNSKNNKDNKNPRVAKTTKKLRFITEQETSELSSILGI